MRGGDIPNCSATSIAGSEHAGQLVIGLRIAERLIAEYGRLPRYKWLIQNGYRGLCTARAHHAHLFAHLTP